jgi:hypothetical protein
MNSMPPGAVPPSNMGARRKPRRSNSHMPKSSSEQNRLRNEDSKVRRGAEIIRQQIQQKLDDEDAYQKHVKHAEITKARLLRERVDHILKTSNSVVLDDVDPEQKHAEMKWKSALGDGDGSRGNTCSTTGSSDEEEGGKPFWGPAGEKRRAALYEGAVDLISKGRESLQIPYNESTRLPRPEAAAEFLCPAPCTADMMDGRSPFHERVEQWPGNPESDTNPPPPPPEDADTPITFIGRGKSLRSKMVTYLVEPFESEDEDNETDFSASEGFSDDFDVEASGFYSTSTTTTSQFPTSMGQAREEAKAKRVERLDLIKEYESAHPMQSAEMRESPPRQEERKAVVVTPTAAALGAAMTTTLAVPSPISDQQSALRKDPAYRHAQNAGFLWQSLVGQQIRFPRQWWGEARTPPMGANADAKAWHYLGRYQIRSNKSLNKMVRSRAAPGRLLLHIVVQDLMTWKPVQDVVIGCFHPNARGIRGTKDSDPKEEMNRDIWFAVRTRSDVVSAVDSLLMMGKSWEASSNASPLGPRQRVANNNVRAVFGEEPPVETVFALESDLYQQLSNMSPGTCAPLALLEEYVLG